MDRAQLFFHDALPWTLRRAAVNNNQKVCLMLTKKETTP